MGAIIEKVPRQWSNSFLTRLQYQGERTKPTVIAVKFPPQHLEDILTSVKDETVKGPTLINNVLQYRFACCSARLRKRPVKNILAVMPTAWEKWSDLEHELYAHSSGEVYLLDNSEEASYCADKEIVLNERGEVVAERSLGCLC